MNAFHTSPTLTPPHHALQFADKELYRLLIKTTLYYVKILLYRCEPTKTWTSVIVVLDGLPRLSMSSSPPSPPPLASNHPPFLFAVSAL